MNAFKLYLFRKMKIWKYRRKRCFFAILLAVIFLKILIMWIAKFLHPHVLWTKISSVFEAPMVQLFSQTATFTDWIWLKCSEQKNKHRAGESTYAFTLKDCQDLLVESFGWVPVCLWCKIHTQRTKTFCLSDQL